MKLSNNDNNSQHDELIIENNASCISGRKEDGNTTKVIFPASVPFVLPIKSNFEQDLKVYQKAKLRFLLSIIHDDKAVVEDGLPIEVNELTESFIIGASSNAHNLRNSSLNTTNHSSKRGECQQPQAPVGNDKGNVTASHDCPANEEDRVSVASETTLSSSTDKVKLPSDPVSVQHVNTETRVVDNSEGTGSSLDNFQTKEPVKGKWGVNRKEFRWERLSFWKTLRISEILSEKKAGEDEREDLASLLKGATPHGDSGRVAPIFTSSSLVRESLFRSKTKAKNEFVEGSKCDASNSSLVSSVPPTLSQVPNEMPNAPLVEAPCSNPCNISTSRTNEDTKSVDTKKTKKKKKKGRSSSSSSEDLESLEKRSEARLGKR